MYKITICQSVGTRGTVVVARTLATLYEEEIPDNIDDIVEGLGGDCYDIEQEDEDDEEA